MVPTSQMPHISFKASRVCFERPPQGIYAIECPIVLERTCNAVSYIPLQHPINLYLRAGCKRAAAHSDNGSLFSLCLWPFAVSPAGTLAQAR